MKISVLIDDEEKIINEVTIKCSDEFINRLQKEIENAVEKVCKQERKKKNGRST